MYPFLFEEEKERMILWITAARNGRRNEARYYAWMVTKMWLRDGMEEPVKRKWFTTFIRRKNILNMLGRIGTLFPSAFPRIRN